MKLDKLFEILPKSKIKAGSGKTTGSYQFFTSSNSTHLFADEYLYDCEAIIIGTGGLPSCNYFNGKFSTSTDTFVLKSKGNILPKFLYHYLSFNNYSILAKGFHGSGLKHISKKYVLNLIIPEIDISTQKQIIRIFDKFEELFALNENRIKLLDELIVSKFIEMFGDPLINSQNIQTRTIKETCFVTKLAGYEYSKYINYQNSGEVVMIKAQNVKSGILNDKELSYISLDVSNSLPRSQLKENDLVMTYVGANLGDLAIVDNKHRYHLAPNVAKISPDNRILNPYFLIAMLSLMRPAIIKSSTDTAKGVINMERIRKLKIIFPHIQLQNEFAEFYLLQSKFRTEYDKKIKLLVELSDKKMNAFFVQEVS